MMKSSISATRHKTIILFTEDFFIEKPSLSC